MKPPCPCGKRAWTSKDEADRVVIDAKIRAGLKHSTRRREQRSYACPTKPGIWHVTSQTGPSYDISTPPLPDYPVTDDEAAADLIADALRRQNDTTWAALLSDTYAEQTCRVLDRLRLDLSAQETERYTRLEAIQSRWRIGDGTTADDVERVRADLNDWRVRVVHFKAAVKARLNDARQAVTTLNEARSEARTSRDNDHHRDTLRLLTVAVARHLRDTDHPTPADRRLWAWLTVLTAPHHQRPMSLADLLAGRHWTDIPDELGETA